MRAINIGDYVEVCPHPVFGTAGFIAGEDRAQVGDRGFVTKANVGLKDGRDGANIIFHEVNGKPIASRCLKKIDLPKPVAADKDFQLFCKNGFKGDLPECITRPIATRP